MWPVVLSAGRSAADTPPAERRASRRAWAQLIRRIYESAPLLCDCGAEMKIIAFIIDHSAVDKILRHLKRREEEGRGRGPPGRSERQALS